MSNDVLTALPSPPSRIVRRLLLRRWETLLEKKIHCLTIYLWMGRRQCCLGQFCTLVMFTLNSSFGYYFCLSKDFPFILLVVTFSKQPLWELVSMLSQKEGVTPQWFCPTSTESALQGLQHCFYFSCSKSSQTSSLRTHLEIHSWEKPDKCN